MKHARKFAVSLPLALVAVLLAGGVAETALAAETPSEVQATFDGVVRPMLAKYCLGCHSTKEKKGSLDLERFVKLDDVRKHVKPWQNMIEQVETGEMPPKDKPQPTDVEKRELLAWVRSFLDAEARARTGDPGHLPLRRLSNAEYDATIRDLTQVDLRPTREFPQDGAGGEGFTNASESLTDISPVLFARYLSAAKEIADHAVLLPDGFRFSPAKTRRDWSDEATARLRKYYSQVWPTADGGLSPLLGVYLRRTVAQREALGQGKFEEAAAASPALNSKYLRALWLALNDQSPSEPLDAIRAKWRKAIASGKEADADEIVADVKALQSALWRTATVGDYIRSTDGKLHVQSNSVAENLSRQVPFDDPAADSVNVRLAIKPAPGQSTVTLYLAANESGSAGPIEWQRPRMEGAGKPTLLLRDYADFGPAFETDLRSAFSNTTKYLAAVAELAHAMNGSPEVLAEKHGLDATYLKQWVKTLAIVPLKPSNPTVTVAAPLTLLDAKTTPGHGGAISGWTKQGADLPVVVANSSERTLTIPGRVSPRTVAVHPTPTESVAVAWKSPLTGGISMTARVSQAHACGNGVAWQLEHRRGDRATMLGDGVLDSTQEVKLPSKSLKVEKGDLLVLAVDPRDGNHACDLTELELTITDETDAKRVWDLGKDVAWEIQASNPHADKLGQADTWSFARGPLLKPSANKAPPSVVAGNSSLGRWRMAASDPERRAEADELAKQVERILTGPQPNEKDVERSTYDRLVAVDSPLLAGVDLTKVAKPAIKSANSAEQLGLPKERFALPARENVIESSDKVVVIQLPASLFIGREFVVDAKIDNPQGSRFVRIRVATTPPDAAARSTGPLLAAANGAAYRRMLAGNAEFRRLFPLFTC
ncbi:MAG TPA: DUF1587 domain-containing protein, partial [Pirellulaceae bacterium]|nr:DUF1587 domain-containing protein [Pirellulaceae bacterium]